MKKIIQIESKKQITYRWWRASKKAIKPEHVEALNRHAEEHITEMMKDGYTSGELHDNVSMTRKDPHAGVEYTGYWEVKTIEDVVEPAWLNQVKEALTHATMSHHHPCCKGPRGFPNVCTCHIRKAKDALEAIKKGC